MILLDEEAAGLGEAVLEIGKLVQLPQLSGSFRH
jgi:hypothetical protein